MVVGAYVSLAALLASNCMWILHKQGGVNVLGATSYTSAELDKRLKLCIGAWMLSLPVQTPLTPGTTVVPTCLLTYYLRCGPDSPWRNRYKRQSSPFSSEWCTSKASSVQGLD
jgi:hypothetical protein